MCNSRWRQLAYQQIHLTTTKKTLHVRVVKVDFGLVWFMVLNATFNNISVISWWSVLLVEETRVPGENNRPVTNYWPLFHIMLYRVHQAMIARYGHSFTYRFKELVVYLIHNQTSFVRLYLTAEKKVFFAKPVSSFGDMLINLLLICTCFEQMARLSFLLWGTQRCSF